MQGLKDERLAALAGRYNVAQFLSFSAGSDLKLRYGRIRGRAHDEAFADIYTAVRELMNAAGGSVNVRSFRPGQEKGNPFEYGITKVDDAVSKVAALAADGYLTIVNETIDVADGGVSGVALRGILEFVPLDTPRGVEQGGTASLPYKLGFDLLKTVYGFAPDIAGLEDARIEFSVHPKRVGYSHGHTVLWEAEWDPSAELRPTLFWPNRFSRFIGDKVFGLLVAHHLDLPVPATTVMPRALAPFRFGRATGTGEIWMRTCPAEQQPGLFTTTFGWQDPYRLMAREDPKGARIASIAAQEAVEPVYSGASLPGSAKGGDFVEGVAGPGDRYMAGLQSSDDLPPGVTEDVQALARRARNTLGPVRLEFAHDGHQPWVLQLHLSKDRYRRSVISPGRPEHGWLDFDPAAGLAALRELISSARADGNGIRVVASVGLGSHVGDLLRKAGIPAKLQPRAAGVREPGQPGDSQGRGAAQ